MSRARIALRRARRRAERVEQTAPCAAHATGGARMSNAFPLRWLLASPLRPGR